MFTVWTASAISKLFFFPVVRHKAREKGAPKKEVLKIAFMLTVWKCLSIKFFPAFQARIRPSPTCPG